MIILTAQTDPSGSQASRPEVATSEPASTIGVAPSRSPERTEVDAGVVLFGLVFPLLLIIPVTVALFRFRMIRRRAEAMQASEKFLSQIQEVRHPRDPAVTDPWQESGRRVEIDPHDDGSR